ncbi:extracellular lipase, putative [Talaromyces stipitatus ATCC 10500]|uniref:Carboxylic ester hydrolase n=1 Tax=Talaromyces stipitatus (strain ATCC 10500 / CBS 375.48 / QM 6759 / NRRL 1006) TaxID=441959 RepID=B8LXQ9_TALSN|nr:extracellular lipase, putative [Talaromyces stipitatus ATCC 10500]EED24560.1 extracellular lipase, putative [Talaromyces stipitatus ATCC 10500]
MVVNFLASSVLLLLSSNVLSPVSAAVIGRRTYVETDSVPEGAPTVTLKNGSYYGVHNAHYNQDFFLGMPYSQPPLGELRLQVPQSLNETWTGTRDATQYSPECIGYGSDQWVLGNDISEDCLTINVIRPSSIAEDEKLPVLFWIHGGGFFEGGSKDPRYNQSFVVQRSVEIGKPIIGVSVNYRLSGWGFLWGEEVAKAGVTNLGIRDQRLALHWVQENIAAFGGDPEKVTIHGESAGGASVGTHFIAYEGRDDGLFRAGIAESGGPTALTYYLNASAWEPNYQKIVDQAGCSNAADTLACLRTVPTEKLSTVFNSSDITPSAMVVIDGDILTESATSLTKQGKFVRAPLLIGTNFDEGTSFGIPGINTTEQFKASLLYNAPDLTEEVINKIAELYPDIPSLGIPATLNGRPPPGSPFGTQWKRSAAYGGDLVMHTGRRITTEAWARYGVPAYSYHFNVLVNGVTDYIGSTHFMEVAFVFDNTAGQGYENAVSVNPFANEPPTFNELASIMSSAWISFVHDLDPNSNAFSHKKGINREGLKWPAYDQKNPSNIAFNVNVTGLAYVEPDTFRAEAIAYMAENLDGIWGLI